MKKHPAKLHLHRETLRHLSGWTTLAGLRGGIEDSRMCCEELLTKTCDKSENCTAYC